MRITPAQLAQMLRHAAETDAEVCGIVLGPRGAAPAIAQVIAARNVHPVPERHFLADAAALLRADRLAEAAVLEVVGFYHSHPGGAAVPSDHDRADAWLGRLMLIVGGAGAHRYLAAWRVDADRRVWPVAIVVAAQPIGG